MAGKRPSQKGRLKTTLPPLVAAHQPSLCPARQLPGQGSNWKLNITEFGCVQSGYLAIETHRDRPGIVRLVSSTEAPDPAPEVHADRRLRYIARFNDVEAALMHTHEILRRRLIDLDTRLYRVPPERAIAAVESLDLKQRRTYLDSEFSDESRSAIASLTEGLRSRRRAWATIFQTLGYIGIGILLFNMLFLSFG
jgi:hypothetical protein